jgi:2,3-bisphosphoglycerate-independent phosphoglycerate mutase
MRRPVKMHSLIVLLDGATDDEIPDFGNRTPLQVARKPFIDSIASGGTFGTTDACGYTHLFLLELFSKRKEDIPRGLIETLGFDLDVPQGRVAYRLSPATLVDGRVRWGYVISEEEINRVRESFERNLHLIDPLRPIVRYYGEGKGVITIEYETVLDVPSPPVNIEYDYEALGPLRELVEKVRDETDGWAILPWQGGPGSLMDEYADVRERLSGISFLSNSPSALGVGTFLGMDKIWIDDLEERIVRAAELAKTGDVLLHIEEIDDVGHKREPRLKLDFLEEMDKLLEKYLKGKQGIRLSFIVDHGCSSITGEHDENPVPFAVSDDLSGRESGKSFEESREGHVPLPQLLEILMER